MSEDDLTELAQRHHDRYARAIFHTPDFLTEESREEYRKKCVKNSIKRAVREAIGREVL